jgi:type II secretory pathway component PulJ
MQAEKNLGARRVNDRRGFTLVELMIALVVAIIAIGAVYAVYSVQQREYRNQQLRQAILQNLRGAMVIMELQIRMAGFDPEDSGRFGITDVRRYDLVTTDADPGGQPALFFTVDVDENGAPEEGRPAGHYPDGSNRYRNREHCNFRMRDDKTTGRRYLAWDNGGGRKTLAENIQAMGLAYGVDNDGDGRIDTWAGGAFPVWAVDADGDNRLDTHLDADNNGVIDERDDTNGDLRITAEDGGKIDPPIGVESIRSVRVWLLAASAHPVQGHFNQRPYVVGDRIYQDSGDHMVRRMEQTTIVCRNL